MDDKKEIWQTLASEKYPALTEDQLGALSLEAATLWYTGEETELAKLFDQYVMIKNLKGL